MADGYDLRHHGDTEVVPGLVDLAVNVSHEPMPAWLVDALARSLTSLRAYPDATAATAAVAARHGRAPDEVLLTAGAAEAFVLLARALRPSHAVVVHPQFTEPEQALRAAGHVVERVVLSPPFVLDPLLVPESADLVMVGNPTNPTSVLHPRAVLEQLRRPGRLLVVDEAFLDAVVDEPDTMTVGDLSGVVVLRSLTKTWGLAGLRVGYVIAEPHVIASLRARQPLWSVSTPALEAAVACSSPAALHESRRRAGLIADHRSHLLHALTGFDVVAPAAAPFVLLRADADLRSDMRESGFVLRRGDTFPGLGPRWVRIGVRAPDVTDALAAALSRRRTR